MPTVSDHPIIAPGGRAAVTLVAALACLPLLALAQFTSHARTDEFDSWLFAHYGRELLAGKMLYRDVWDNKPPGIFWINAFGLWLARGSLWGVWALCAVAVCGATALVFAASKRLYGLSAAAIGAVLAALYLNIHPYHVGCDRPSTFLVATELAAFACYAAALTARRWVWPLLIAAGFAAGLGLCLHQAGLAVTAAVIAHLAYLAISRRSRWIAVVGKAVLFGLGWCLAVGGGVAAIYRTSDPHWAWNAVVAFNRLYFTAEDGATLFPRFFAFEEHLKVLGLPLVLVLATVAQPLLRRFVGGAKAREHRPPTPVPGQPVPPAHDPRINPAAPDAAPSTHEVDDDPIGRRPHGLLLLLWAWLLAAIYLALLGPHQRMQYFGVALPPMVMLSAHGIYLLLRSGRRLDDVRPAYHVVVGVLWFGYMMIWPIHAQVRAAQIAHYRRFDEPPESRHVALLDALRRHTGPEDAIFVSGYGPQLYWDAERHSAIRYIGTEKVGQLGKAGQPLLDEISQLLMAAKPKAIVVDAERLKVSVHPSITDGRALNEWIQTHYTHPPDYPGDNLWIRRALPAELKGPTGPAEPAESP